MRAEREHNWWAYRQGYPDRWDTIVPTEEHSVVALNNNAEGKQHHSTADGELRRSACGRALERGHSKRDER